MQALWMLVSILISDLIYPFFVASLIAAVKRIRLVGLTRRGLMSRDELTRCVLIGWITGRFCVERRQ